MKEELQRDMRETVANAAELADGKAGDAVKYVCSCEGLRGTVRPHLGEMMQYKSTS